MRIIKLECKKTKNKAICEEFIDAILMNDDETSYSQIYTYDFFYSYEYFY